MPALLDASYPEDVAPFRSAAAKEGVDLHSASLDTRWFRWAGDDGVTIGVCALKPVATGVRVKGVWVRPEHRGKGHGRAMTFALIERAGDMPENGSRIEAYAHNPEFYESMGWQRLGGVLSSGAVRVARNL